MQARWQALPNENGAMVLGNRWAPAVATHYRNAQHDVLLAYGQLSHHPMCIPTLYLLSLVKGTW